MKIAVGAVEASALAVDLAESGASDGYHPEVLMQCNAGDWRPSKVNVNMSQPYQCLASCTRSAGEGLEWLLFGASGSQLVAQSSTGASSTWTPETPAPEVKVSNQSS